MPPAYGHGRDAAASVQNSPAMHALSLQSTHCRYNFPSRADACHAVLELVFAHPEKTILIGIDKLGKGDFSSATRPCFLYLPPLPPSPAFVSLSKFVLWALGVLHLLPPCRAFWRLWQHPLASACAFLQSAGPFCVCWACPLCCIQPAATEKSCLMHCIWYHAEELLAAVAAATGERICVPAERWALLGMLGLPTARLFTTDTAAARIHAVLRHSVSFSRFPAMIIVSLPSLLSGLCLWMHHERLLMWCSSR